MQKHAWRFVARPLCCFSIYPNSSADKRHVDVVVAHDHVDAILPMPVYLEIMHMMHVHAHDHECQHPLCTREPSLLATPPLPERILQQWRLS